MLIGEVSKRSGYSRDTIRYYEKIGLITVGSHKQANGVYKNYSVAILERLHQIRRLKECGFSLPEIRRLLVHDSDRHACDDLPAQVAEKVRRIDRNVALLLGFRKSLLQIQRSCGGACASNMGMPDCIPGTSERTPASSR